MLEWQFAGLFSCVGIFHCLSDNLRVVSLADHLVKAAIGTASAHCRQMTIFTAIVEDRLKRVAGKALKLDICPGEESAAFRCLPVTGKRASSCALMSSRISSISAPSEKACRR